MDRWAACDKSANRSPGAAPGAPAATICSRCEAERECGGADVSTSYNVPLMSERAACASLGALMLRQFR